jgi:hypothetical protein
LKNLEYAYLQLGEQGKAREVMGKIGKLAVEPGGDPWSAVDAPIYFDVDTHDWNDAVGIHTNEDEVIGRSRSPIRCGVNSG